MFSDPHLYFIANLRIVMKELLCILPSLSDLRIIIGIPSAALGNDPTFRCQIQNISVCGDSLSEYNIKLCLFEGRCNLILYNFDAGMVTYHLSALLQCLCTAYIQTDGSLELQRASTGSRLRITEHNSNLFTQLIDKDHTAV